MSEIYLSEWYFPHEKLPNKNDLVLVDSKHRKKNKILLALWDGKGFIIFNEKWGNFEIYYPMAVIAWKYVDFENMFRIEEE